MTINIKQKHHRSRFARGGIFLKLILWGGAAILLMIGVLACVYSIYGWRSRIALEAKVAALAAAGEPIRLQDFQPKTVDEALNALTPVKKATSLLPTDDSLARKREEFNGSQSIPLREEERATIATYVLERQAALAELRNATTRPVADAQVRLVSPLINLNVQLFSEYRTLARLCGDAATIEYDKGNHRNAFELLEPIEPIAQVSGSTPTLVGYLVAVGIRTIETDCIIQFAPELKIGSGQNDVSTEQLRSKIDSLLTDERAQKSLRRAFQAERFFQLDTLISIAGGTVSTQQAIGGNGTAQNSFGGFLGRPLIYSNASFCLDVMGDYIKATAAQDLPTARKQFAAAGAQVSAVQGSLTRVFARLLLPSLDRVFIMRFRKSTDNHLAATALAIRWYQCEHNGQLPKTLEELVPKYLPEVPIDLLSGKPIQYRPDGDDPIIWSVGDNEKDDGGSTAPSRKMEKKPGPFDRWQMLDAVVHLKRQPRPATEPSE